MACIYCRGETAKPEYTTCNKCWQAGARDTAMVRILREEAEARLKASKAKR